MTRRDWERHAREDLAPKMASSAYVITIDPGVIDPKVALETGYAVMLGKPILLLVPAGRRAMPGLARIAREVLELTEPLEAMTSQLAIRAALERMAEMTEAVHAATEAMAHALPVILAVRAARDLVRDPHSPWEAQRVDQAVIDAINDFDEYAALAQQTEHDGHALNPDHLEAVAALEDRT